jgi:hypothetical protein
VKFPEAGAGGPFRKVKKKTREVLRIYIACAYAEAETADTFGGRLVAALRARGIEAVIGSRWHGAALQAGTTNDPEDLGVQREALAQNLADLSTSHRMVVLGTVGNPRATFSEVGAFLPCPIEPEDHLGPKWVAWVYEPLSPSTTNLFMAHPRVAPVSLDTLDKLLISRALGAVGEVATIFADPLTASVFSCKT